MNENVVLAPIVKLQIVYGSRNSELKPDPISPVATTPHQKELDFGE
jgi:hypothetical protein